MFESTYERRDYNQFDSTYKLYQLSCDINPLQYAEIGELGYVLVFVKRLIKSHLEQL